MSEKNSLAKNPHLLNARIQAAMKLQALAFDAANRTPGKYMNRDLAMDVVDAIAAVVLETLNTYLDEEKNDAAATN